jgi:CRISPR-associated protein Csm2
MNGHYSGQNHPVDTPLEFPTKEKLKKWLENQIDQEAIKFADDCGKYLSQNDFKTNQIRRIFGEVKRIQMKKFSAKEQTDLLLIKPKLAYTVGRIDKKEKSLRNAVDKLRIMIFDCIDIILNQQDTKNQIMFENFANLFEAILAYHKFYGGRE